MFKVMLETLDMAGNAEAIASGFFTQDEARQWMDDNEEQFPEKVGFWIADETMDDVFGDEAMDNVMHGGGFNNMGEWV